jgi:hypothetical protein
VFTPPKRFAHPIGNMFCKVRGCRYPGTHATCAHRCGICSTYGHGQQECGKPNRILGLLNDSSYRRHLPESLQCIVDGCNLKWSHSAPAHHCPQCNGRGETHALDCPREISVSKTCPICKNVGTVDLGRKVFTGTECCICMEAGPVVIFEPCAHASVCVECVRRL